MLLAFDESGAGLPVVLIHGHPFDRTMWSGQLRSLGGAFRLIAPDLRGYGESPVTAGTVTMGELADDVWALLDHLQVDEVAAVGLSMGGLVAMEMALARPQRVWALGLVATTAAPVAEEERRERLALADVADSAGMEPLVRAMGPRLFGAGADPAVVDRTLQMMSRNDPHGSAAALRGRAERPDYRERLHALAIPSWVCVGDQDTWSTEAVTDELVRSLREPQTLTLPGVGHLPNLEAPERFDADLARFLRAARPRSRGG